MDCRFGFRAILFYANCFYRVRLGSVFERAPFLFAAFFPTRSFDLTRPSTCSAFSTGHGYISYASRFCDRRRQKNEIVVPNMVYSFVVFPPPLYACVRVPSTLHLAYHYPNPNRSPNTNTKPIPNTSVCVVRSVCLHACPLARAT